MHTFDITDPDSRLELVKALEQSELPVVLLAYGKAIGVLNPIPGESQDSGYQYVIAELEKTCGACPSAWHGTTTCKKSVYVRYRHGHLTVLVDGIKVVGKEVDKLADGFMDLDELKEHAPMIKWD